MRCIYLIYEVLNIDVSKPYLCHFLNIELCLGVLNVVIPVYPPGWGLDTRLTTLLYKKNYCFKIQRSENRTVSF